MQPDTPGRPTVYEQATDILAEHAAGRRCDRCQSSGACGRRAWAYRVLPHRRPPRTPR